MTGKHILAEFWQCQCDPQLLTSTQPLLELLTKAVDQAGLTLVGHAVHEFQQHGGEVGGQSKECVTTDKPSSNQWCDLDLITC